MQAQSALGVFGTTSNHNLELSLMEMRECCSQLMEK